MKSIEIIHKSFKTRQVKYGGYAALLTMAIVTGLILLNLIVGQFSLQKDLSLNQRFTLSEQTIQLLDTLESPVRFFGLWRPGEESLEVMTVINLYLARSRHISFEMVDPDRNPGFVLRYDRERRGIPRGSLIVEGDMGFRVINPWDFFDIAPSHGMGGHTITGVAVERRLTSAILFVGTGTIPVIYEIIGHGETPLSAIGLDELMERENHELRPLNLMISPIPDDASALIMNNPRRDITAETAEILLEYLAAGGRLLILADYNIQELNNLNEVLASYALRLDYGVVIEDNPAYVTAIPLSLLPDVLPHEITWPLADKTRTPILLLRAMSLSILETRRMNVEVTPLLISSRDSFLRTDLNEASVAQVPSDIPGPLILGAAVADPFWVSDDEPQARIVVIACGSLLPIAAQGFQANWDLFMNSLIWLQDRPETISVRSSSLFLMPMRLNLGQMILFGFLFIFVIPTALFISGFVCWLKRRNL